MLSDIVTKFAYHSSQHKKIHLFYDFNQEIDKILLGKKDHMVVMLKLAWWKERLEEIRLDKKGNFNPLLLEIKRKLNKAEVTYLQQIINAKLIDTGKVNPYNSKEAIDEYLGVLAQAKSSFLKVSACLIAVYSALEYIEQNLHEYEAMFLNELFYFAKTKHKKLNYNVNCKLEKIYYQSSKILISKYKPHTGRFNITPNYFRILLGIKLL